MLLDVELAICSKCDRREDTGFYGSNDQYIDKPEVAEDTNYGRAIKAFVCRALHGEGC
jgi:hypothetical protein